MPFNTKEALEKGVVNHLIDCFKEEGLTTKQINESFSKLMSD